MNLPTTCSTGTLARISLRSPCSPTGGVSAFVMTGGLAGLLGGGGALCLLGWVDGAGGRPRGAGGGACGM